MPQPEGTARRSSTTQQGSFPDFLVIGTRHSGASVLRDLLRRFPTIHLPPEGSAFFERDFDRGARWYRSRFNAAPEAETVGDLSLCLEPHVDHELVVARIDGLLPDVRLVAVLRDPVERALAHHRELVLAREVPPETSVVDLLKSEDDQHDLVPTGHYGRALLPFVETFEQRLLLIDHRELITNPGRTVVEVATHIGAPVTADPRSSGDRSDRENLEVPQQVRRELADRFREDLNLLYRATGFRFTAPEAPILDETGEEIADGGTR